jgi:hypothetical protein
MRSSPVRPLVAIWRSAVRRLSSLVVLALALNFGSVALVHGAQRGDDTGSFAGSLRPLDLVRSSVSRVLAIAQSPPAGITGSEDRRTGIRRVAHDLFAFDEMARRVIGNLYNSSIRTSSFAQLMERMRTEQLRRQARDAGTSVRANELASPRGRLEGPVLLGATSYARGR